MYLETVSLCNQKQTTTKKQEQKKTHKTWLIHKGTTNF